LRTVLCETLSILEGTVYICIIVQYLSHSTVVTHCSISFIIIHDHIKLRCILFT